MKSEIVLNTDKRILVKKNSKRVFVKNGRVMVLPSKGYSATAESIMWDFKQSARGRSVSGKVEVDYVFFVKNTKVDFDNLIGSVNDMMQTIGVIDDDAMIVGGKFSKQVGSKNWGCRITIRSIDNDNDTCVG